MLKKVYRIEREDEFGKAGPGDLVRLLPVSGTNAIYLPKKLLLLVVYGIVNHEYIHLSGPTGTAKSSLIEALYLAPENFRVLCKELGYEDKPLRVFPCEMALFESPGELYQRRALKDGATYDERSSLVNALSDASVIKEKHYPLIWLREIGRVHATMVQGGLLNLMTKGDIVLPDFSRLSGKGIAWIADSNYQAENDSRHNLVPMDEALNRRFSMQLTMDYLPAEQEMAVLSNIVQGEINAKRL